MRDESLLDQVSIVNNAPPLPGNVDSASIGHSTGGLACG